MLKSELKIFFLLNDTYFQDKFKLGLQVESRNEPANIVQVAEVVSERKNMRMEDITEICYRNAFTCFGIKFDSKEVELKNIE